MNISFQKIKAYRKIILLSVIILGVFFYAFWSSLANKDFVVIPQMFWDARAKGDVIAEQFVNLSKTTQDNLQTIRDLDDKGRADLALVKIRVEIKRGDELKSKGTELLGALSQMTYSLGGIRPDGARTLAYDAITHRIDMVNSLVTYSANLEQILNLLTTQTVYGENVSNALNEQIYNANKNADNINNLNNQFNDAMKKLESY